MTDKNMEPVTPEELEELGGIYEKMERRKEDGSFRVYPSLIRITDKGSEMEEMLDAQFQFSAYQGGDEDGLTSFEEACRDILVNIADGWEAEPIIGGLALRISFESLLKEGYIIWDTRSIEVVRGTDPDESLEEKYQEEYDQFLEETKELRADEV
jgi:hypothetical protein